MQRLEYRTHIAETIFVGVCGVALLAGCVTLIVQGMMSESGGAMELIIGFIALPLALYFVASALRPGALTADDTGLRLRRAFGTQHIPWAAVRSFRMVALGRAGPRVQAILHTGEVIWLPRTTNSGAKSRRIVAELTAALGEHARPLEPPSDAKARR
jgi:Bacterial PH domain